MVNNVTCPPLHNTPSRDRLLPRASRCTMLIRVTAAALLSTAPVLVAWAADADDIAALKRALAALREENRALAKRLETLETGNSNRAPSKEAGIAQAAPSDKERDRLEQRVNELERSKAAQEDAVRTIIRDSVATLGSKINESVSLGGTLTLGASRNREFSGERKSTLGLNGLDFQFEVQVSDWALGHIKLDYVDGKNQLFTTAGGQAAPVDRINVDTAYLTLGDAQRFPLTLNMGRMVLPFGISTGRPVADTLSITNPTTVEVFEMNNNALMLGAAFPTPALKPPTPAVFAPPVQPLVLAPLFGALGRGLGYQPSPLKPRRPSPLSLAPEHAPFDAGLLFYEGQTPGGIRKHFGATAGYRAKGNCGRRYEELAGSGFCPWAVNVDVNYNSSIFNSRFLRTEYAPFLNKIERVPAIAASVKANLGPMAVIGEWNGATKRAHFTDDSGAAVAIQPRAWQLSLGYQLDWNPWVQEIGAQGTYLAIGYSQSSDLAGVQRLVEGVQTRVGFVPKRRLLLTAGEWVVDGLRVVLELSRDWDYSLSEGGTGKTGSGIATTLTYSW